MLSGKDGSNNVSQPREGLSIRDGIIILLAIWIGSFFSFMLFNKLVLHDLLEFLVK